MVLDYGLCDSMSRLRTLRYTKMLTAEMIQNIEVKLVNASLNHFSSSSDERHTSLT